MISQAIGRVPAGAVPTTPAAPAETLFGGLAQLAAGVCASPLACLAIFGLDDVWCTASAPLPAAARPRSDPFAVHAARASDLFEVDDAMLDERFRDAELVNGPPAVRSYAGLALRASSGETLGTLAVYGAGARTLTAEQRVSLRLLAEQTVALVELQARHTELALLSDARPAATAALLDSAPVAVYHTDAAGNMLYSNPEYRRMFGLAPGHHPDAWAQRVHTADRERMQHAWADFCRQPRSTVIEPKATTAASAISLNKWWPPTARRDGSARSRTSPT